MQHTDTNQHYVSQFLLRGFHAGSPAQIWAFDKLTGRSFTTAIKDVASEHGFYNIGDSTEIDEVIRKFEHATAPIVEEIRARKTLSGLAGCGKTRAEACCKREFYDISNHDRGWGSAHKSRRPRI